ncbi:hypothetical protein LTR85_005991 [Meristemomyces frigidus]|nr:hypothetical protein LTR85_005991 [Meristemomyces frigidus]
MARFTFTFAFMAATVTSAMQLNVDTTSKTSSAAGTLASNLMNYYTDSDNGVLPQPYWWWESAGLWSTMVQYWHYTGDSSYNDAVTSAIAAQAGSGQDFMGTNALGNDDQLWWGIAAMTAAEYKFQAPSSGSSWLRLAENVFDEVQGRWDTNTCNGGLHWQISSSASGYSYKNAVSNGLFFQLAARLARYTGDSKYTTEATTIWNWVHSVGLVDKSTYRVYDGTDSSEGCTSLDHDEWSYNVGVYLYGAAVMLDHTGDLATWQPHVDGLVAAASAAFTSTEGILHETQCELDGTCDTDQLSFKAYLSRWLAATAALVPSTATTIKPLLSASVEGAIASCNGGPDSSICGFKWTTDTYDGTQGVGQQLAALEIVQGLLASSSPLPSAASKRKLARRFEA